MEKEKNDAYKFATENLIKELLPVLDNLERAIDHGETKGDAQGLLAGVELTLKGLLRRPWKNSAWPRWTPPAKNSIPTCTRRSWSRKMPGNPAGTVLNQLQKGYLLHTRLIRPAMVVVSKKPEPG